jgi:hypothetical protein
MGFFFVAEIWREIIFNAGIFRGDEQLISNISSRRIDNISIIKLLSCEKYRYHCNFFIFKYLFIFSLKLYY